MFINYIKLMLSYSHKQMIILFDDKRENVISLFNVGNQHKVTFKKSLTNTLMQVSHHNHSDNMRS